MMRRALVLVLAVGAALAAGVPSLSAGADPAGGRVAEAREMAARLIEFAALPSASDDAAGAAAAAAWARDQFRALGMQAQLLPGEGNPLVFAEGSAERPALTVLFYAHYDTQPTGAKEDWGATGGRPFAATLLSGKWDEPGARPIDPRAIDAASLETARLYARGVADDKAPIVMHLAALKRWLQTPAARRIHLKYLLDGEEEAGSPHIATALARHAGLLRADLLVLCDGPMDALGRRSIYLGARGDMHMRLSVRTAAQSGHSGNYGLLPNAAWKLAWLLSTMRAPDGKATIEGFEDDVVAPTSAERAALQEASLAEPVIAAQLGVTAFEGDPSAPYYERLVFHPGFIINQIAAGRPGNQIPVTAEALLEARLVTRQDPAKVFEAVRRHVAARLPEARLEMLDSEPAARMDPADPAIARAIEAATRAQGSRVLVYPSLGGTLPLLHPFTAAGYKYIGLPLVNFDNNQHVANENVRLGVLPDGMRFLIGFLDALAGP